MYLSREPNYQKKVDILTGWCIASTVVLILFLIFGPKEGAEAMGILFPWLVAGYMHVFLGVAALFYVWKSGSFLKNAWILIYFMLFFGINGYTLAVFNEVDKAIVRGIHTITKPEQAELYDILRSMKVGSSGRYQLSPSAAERVHDLVQKGVDVSYISPGYHRTMLMMATLAGDPALVEFMLKQGALADGQNAYASTPLAAAVSNGNSQVVKLLLDNGADPNSPCDLIQYGAQSPEVIRIIAESGVELNHRDPLHRYPLSVLVRHGHPESITYLLKKGAEPLLPDWKGMQPFMHFVRNNQADLVAASIETSQALRENEKQMRDGLYWAVRSAHPEVVKYS